jgi:hypothetical protein
LNGSGQKDEENKESERNPNQKIGFRHPSRGLYEYRLESIDHLSSLITTFQRARYTREADNWFSKRLSDFECLSVGARCCSRPPSMVVGMASRWNTLPLWIQRLLLNRLQKTEKLVKDPLGFTIARRIVVAAPDLPPDRHRSSTVSCYRLCSIDGAQNVVGRKFAVESLRQQRQIRWFRLEFFGDWTIAVCFPPMTTCTIGLKVRSTSGNRNLIIVRSPTGRQEEEWYYARGEHNPSHDGATWMMFIAHDPHAGVDLME